MEKLNKEEKEYLIVLLEGHIELLNITLDFFINDKNYEKNSDKLIEIDNRLILKYQDSKKLNEDIIKKLVTSDNFLEELDKKEIDYLLISLKNRRQATISCIDKCHNLIDIYLDDNIKRRSILFDLRLHMNGLELVENILYKLGDLTWAQIDY